MRALGKEERQRRKERSGDRKSVSTQREHRKLRTDFWGRRAGWDSLATKKGKRRRVERKSSPC